MTVTADTLETARRSRIALDRTVDAETRGLIRAWSLAWTEIAHEWEDAVDDLIRIGEGQWPTRAQMNRAVKAQKALTLAADRLDELAKNTGQSISGRVKDLVRSAEFWERQMVVASLVKGAGFSLSWQRIDARAIDAIVARATQQIESITSTLSGPAQQAMKRELIRGVTVGANPRAAARRMVARVQGRFLGGMSRATNIASTELLDAYRSSATQSRLANADVITGWRWLATLDRRTCPSCLAMNGTVHPVGEHGPDDHQRGRCVGIPITKTMAELGVMIIDPPAAMFPEARGWFDRQPQATQLSIMGKERLRRYRAGELSWEQMSQVRTSPGWRRSYGTAPLP